MSERAEPQDHELKPHGDKLEGALKPTTPPVEDKQQEPATSGTAPKE